MMTKVRQYITANPSRSFFRRTGAIAMSGLTVFLFCGMTAPQGCTDESNNRFRTEATVAAVGVGAVIGLGIYAGVHHAHHTMKGCLAMGPDGMQLQPDGSTETYTITGSTSTLRPGDRVRLHGSHPKKKKDSLDKVFVVDTLKKDYGPCRVPPSGHAAVTPTSPQDGVEAESVQMN